MGEHVLCFHQQLESTALACGISIQYIFMPVSPLNCIAGPPAHFPVIFYKRHVKRPIFAGSPTWPLMYSQHGCRKQHQQVSRSSLPLIVCMCVCVHVSQKKCVNNRGRKIGIGERCEQNKMVKGVMSLCVCVCVCACVCVYVHKSGLAVGVQL